MVYGAKIYDASGNSSLLMPNISKIIAGGALIMPNSLNGDNTYGTDIDLPGDAGIPVGDIGVMVYPVTFHYQIDVDWWFFNPGTKISFMTGIYADDAETYYTKNNSTGVMTSWNAGNMTDTQQNTWDPVCSIFPLTGWDLPGNPETVTEVRIWAATAYLLWDTSASDGLAVYSIGNKGVETVNYMIFLKNN